MRQKDSFFVIDETFFDVSKLLMSLPKVTWEGPYVLDGTSHSTGAKPELLWLFLLATLRRHCRHCFKAKAKHLTAL